MSAPVTEPVVPEVPTTGPITEPPAAKVTEPSAQPEPSNPSDEIEKWKALSRKNEQRAKENDAAAKRLAEIEEANKTEAEKLLARAEAAEKAAADATAKVLRSDVSLAKGVPAELLSGSTQEELEASADALLAFKGTTPVAAPATPQGPNGEQVNGAKEDIDEQIAEATKAGNHALAITLKRQKAAPKTK